MTRINCKNSHRYTQMIIFGFFFCFFICGHQWHIFIRDIHVHIFSELSIKLIYKKSVSRERRFFKEDMGLLRKENPRDAYNLLYEL